MYSDKLKKALKREKVSIKDLAEKMGKSPQTLYNTLHNEGVTMDSGRVVCAKYNTVEQMLDVLGYDLVFRNRETGEIID